MEEWYLCGEQQSYAWIWHENHESDFDILKTIKKQRGFLTIALCGKKFMWIVNDIKGSHFDDFRGSEFNFGEFVRYLFGYKLYVNFPTVIVY